MSDKLRQLVVTEESHSKDVDKLSSFAKLNKGYLYFIEDPEVITSPRRFDKMTLWKTFLLTHPLFIRLTRRKKALWKDWYEKTLR